MAYEELSALLGGWEGFAIAAVRREPASATQPVPRVVIVLEPVPTRPKRCSRCDGEVVTVHEVTLRRVRDLPLMDAETWIEFPRARVECPRCGPTVEAVPWLDRYQRMTTRLAANGGPVNGGCGDLGVQGCGNLGVLLQGHAPRRTRAVEHVAGAARLVHRAERPLAGEALELPLQFREIVREAIDAVGGRGVPPEHRDRDRLLVHIEANPDSCRR